MGYRFTVSVSEDRVTEHHSLRRGTLPKSAEGSLADRNRFILASDASYKELFNEYFAPYIQAYNDKQKRRDRRWDMDYWQKLIDGGQVEPINSFVIQLGNRDTTAAITDVTFDVKVWRELRDTDPAKAAEYVKQHLNTHPNVDKTADVLEEVARRLPEWYPNFVPVSLVIHMDEPDGTPHLDANGFWVAHKNKRGLDVRCAKQEALKEMGFDGKAFGSPYKDWQADFQEKVTEVMKEMYGFEREVADSHEPHVSIPTYRIQQERQEEADKLRELKRLNEIARVNMTEFETQAKDSEQKLKDLEYQISVADLRYRESYAKAVDAERELKSITDKADAAEARIRMAESRVQEAQNREDDARRAYRRIEDDTVREQKRLDDLKREAEEQKRRVDELSEWIKKLSDIRQMVLLFIKALLGYLEHKENDKHLSMTDRQSAGIAKRLITKLQGNFLDVASRAAKKSLEQILSGRHIYDDVTVTQQVDTPTSQEMNPSESSNGGGQDWWGEYDSNFFLAK